MVAAKLTSSALCIAVSPQNFPPRAKLAASARSMRGD
jgi:hypothetical protein